MAQQVDVHFEANGSLVNLDLGFVPSYVKIFNQDATTGEVATEEWFGTEMDDSASFITTSLVDNGTTADNNVEYVSSGGSISAYDSAAIGNRQSVTFDFTGGASEDLLTVSSGHGFVEGEKIRLVESGGLATDLSESTIYYVKYLSPTTFQVSLTSGGDAVAFSSDGTPPNYVFSLDNLTTSDGFKGITIAAAFMDDGDEIWVHATRADIIRDLGDING